MTNFKQRMNLLESALQKDNKKLIVQRSKEVLEVYKQIGMNFPNRSIYDEHNLEMIEHLRDNKPFIFKIMKHYGFK